LIHSTPYLLELRARRMLFEASAFTRAMHAEHSTL